MTRATAPLLFALLAAGALGACAPGASVSVGPASLRSAPAVTTSSTARAPAFRDYPGAVLLKHEAQGKGSKTEFRTSAALQDVYAHYHAQLENAGWRRSAYEAKPGNKVGAAYRRGDETLRLTLNRQGNSGRYKLELRA